MLLWLHSAPQTDNSKQDYNVNQDEHFRFSYSSMLFIVPKENPHICTYTEIPLVQL